jgi:hypothetical protein
MNTSFKRRDFAAACHMPRTQRNTGTGPPLILPESDLTLVFVFRIIFFRRLSSYSPHFVKMESLFVYSLFQDGFSVTRLFTTNEKVKGK